MSISPTRLIDHPNMLQLRVDFKTALLPESVRHLSMVSGGYLMFTQAEAGLFASHCRL